MDLFGHEDPEEYIVRRRQEMERPAGFATHEALKEAITSCSRCPLRREGGLGPVLSTGPADAPLMIVGEGPGGVEDDYGGPLIGPSGQLLDKALASVGITRDHVYVTNIVKCRPPMNRTPMPDEAAACAGFLQAQIHLLKPQFILAMGRTAVQNLLHTNTGINTLRGQWLEFQFGNEKIPLMATFHPSALLRDERLKAPAWQDLKKFREKLLATKPDYAEIFYSQQNASRQ